MKYVIDMDTNEVIGRVMGDSLTDDEALYLLDIPVVRAEGDEGYDFDRLMFTESPFDVYQQNKHVEKRISGYTEEMAETGMTADNGAKIYAGRWHYYVDAMDGTDGVLKLVTEYSEDTVEEANAIFATIEEK